MPLKTHSLKRKGDLEEGNPGAENIKSFGEFSVNELGSGLKTIPKASVIASHKGTSTVDRSNSRREPPSTTRLKSTKRTRPESDQHRNHNETTGRSKNKESVSNSKPGRAKDISKNSSDTKPQAHSHAPKQGDERKHRTATAREEEIGSAPKTAKQSSKAYDPDNVPLGALKSKSKSHTAAEEESSSNQDDTPLGLLRRNKTLHVANSSSKTDNPPLRKAQSAREQANHPRSRDSRSANKTTKREGGGD
ncbi:hypothetical protein K493DRAFT_351922 [Basidiobolus meristosporus CBS 931.73]|uniref:Uncharacterized protein n=1 Tax=Basidiobolus meristosporus CBS 931.73 TaxID=1314790 RepID=A0A1Y1YAN9_9FUNG|nr:hypothetical protein K493DRAFT_351922 [Basidiobolus meristosporus CBS 931.73]|eukprot:ORX95059.1 hypothetical protein K493DRAFT_351922 [Basidiobolus meristosporus CBS 931.73]